MNRRTLAVFAVLCLFPSAAWANTGTPLMWAGLLHLSIGNLLIGVLEGSKMIVYDEVMVLLRRLIHSSGAEECKGASEEDIVALEQRQGVVIPHELSMWLQQCNGPSVGAGGLCGVGKDKWFDIEAKYKLFPEWKRSGWIPIAGDGAGDYYILDTTSVICDTHPVYFIDQEDYEQPAYVVASGLWPFLRFWLLKEIALQVFGEEFEPYWPFDETRVLKEDPALLLYAGKVPLPWRYDE